MTRILLIAAVSLVAIGCGAPRHMQYDYGRAYTNAFTAQADLTRPSAAQAAHALNGAEAAEIRIRATESATDVETGESELKNASE